ncbi:UNVERIFIED_CONTAM: hypothetical protein GTU68_002713 [Idotea baltica]|nr:hypothetical protein [Idotea baltica]
MFFKKSLINSWWSKTI